MKLTHILIAGCLAAGAAVLFAQQPPAAPAFADETLVYSVNWPSGLSLGEAQSHAKRLASGWKFELSLDAAVPGFTVGDDYRSSAAGDFCSLEFNKQVHHGQRTVQERITFDSQNGTATRLILGASGGSSELSVPACARDTLSFLFYLRRELSQGRLPPAQTIYFGAPYQVRLEYAGTQPVRLNGATVDADRLRASVKGPASDTTFEIVIARDAVRTPVSVHVPFSMGVFSLELVR